MDSVEVRFTYGAISDSIEEQANRQGFTLGEEAEKLELIRKAIVMCQFHVATPAQGSSMRRKLNEKVVRALVPLAPMAK